ncbi:MAG: protein translocase subunit SecF [Candidatus Margulisbacteria bacterium]|nr:protein translocase subunit SecF [Candidatus Margulisiibacteriota bacterium]MBU1022627.1 protein translocase subunit SecF [Candidatus Margulisiibacteriota bacterium]MBU1729436.1 protein translocase subunit SecF [Candidatus Margulisiibacteriota bacterium]MBU1955463.1 protein translocase subunit SecF [Candidatus Margulisiibacteriota bacterium]
MNIIAKKNLWFAISITLILISVAAFLFNSLTKGKIMNFGIDFTGGTLLTVRFDKEVATHEIRDTLAKYGLTQSVIQKTGKDDFSIRTDPLETDVRQKIMNDLREKFGQVELLEADVIGPVIGKELRTQALWALLVASVLITIYVSFRFEFKYAVAALIALYHDAFITAGIIALLWRTVDAPFVAAILTIMGYSINDTIVIFDRIRENIKKPGAVKKHFATIVNESINQTMARSINTVLTTLVMVTALLLFGGATIKDFALVLFVGFLAGAYSSIFVASPLLVLWHRGKNR